LGGSYGSANVTLSISNGVYQATLNPSSGSPVTYPIARVKGYGWSQSFYAYINNSYYSLPFSWKNSSYKNPTGGSWSASAGSWFTSSGALQPTNTNTFRKGAWDKGCSGCHTTGNYVTLNIANGTDSSWTATWANNSDTLNMKVGCEKCHGPGSNHIANPSTSNIFGPTAMQQAGTAREQEVCGQCHIGGTSTNLKWGWPWKESVDSCYQPGTPLSNYIKEPWQNYINQTGGPSMWPDSMTLRSGHGKWNELSYSAHGTFLSCFSCHDPHQVTAYPNQLIADYRDNSLCLQCHGNFGSPGNPNIAAITAHTRHIYDPTNQNQTGGSSRCTNCHMANALAEITPYDMPSHTFKVIRPIQTLLKRGIVLGSNSGNLNSCAVSCHRNPSSAAGTGNVPTLGAPYDSSITNWSQSSDSILADTLNRWFNNQNWNLIGIKPIGTQIPQNFTLGQNYPNPFNPSTKIDFMLPKAAFVTIKIYDIIGKEVFTLVNQKMNAGSYVVDWNSINNAGDYVSSGVYFYRIDAGGFTQTKKMVLLR